MSDLLRVVERSKDDPMEIENFMAREHPSDGGEDPTAPHPPAPSELLGRAARGRRARLGGAARAPVRARDRRRLAARGPLPLLHPPGLPVPDRLRAAARAGRRARAAAGVDAPLRRARRVRARDARWTCTASSRRAGGSRRAARVRAHGAGHRRVLRLPPAHGARSATSRSWCGAVLPCMWGYAEVGRAPGRARAAGPRGLRGVDRARTRATSSPSSPRGAASSPTPRRPTSPARRAGACTGRSARRASTSSRSGRAPGARARAAPARRSRARSRGR